MSRRSPILCTLVVLATWLAGAPCAAADEDPPPAPPPEVNVALARWGAEVTGAGQPFNPSYDVDNVVDGTAQPALFGSKPRGLVGGSVTISLALPMDISAVALTQAQHSGQFDRAKDVQIAVDGKRLKTVTLANQPGARQRFPLEAHGQEVRLTVLSQYDDPETDFGGWNEIELLAAEDQAAALGPPPEFVPKHTPLVQQTRRTAAVIGEPEQPQGHPRILWTAAELAEMRKLVADGAPAAAELRRLVDRLDSTAGEKVTLPPPQETLDAAAHVQHMANAAAVAELALAHALTGDRRHADRAVRLLAAYAAVFANHPVVNRGSPDQARLFNHRRDLAVWLIRMALGYDLLHDSMTEAQRRPVAEKLLREAAACLAEPPDLWRDRGTTTAVATAAVLAAGYALDDAGLIAWGLDGRDGRGGARRIIDLDITGDGAWMNGPIRQPGREAEAVLFLAEAAWRNGVNLYSQSDGRLKRLFDAPLELAYPTFELPSVYRSAGNALLGPATSLYDYALKRYGDPAYLLLAEHVAPQFGLSGDRFLPALWRTGEFSGEPAVRQPDNLAASGLAVLRLGAGDAANQLVFLYGPEQGSDRADVLAFDLFGLGRPLMPSPGASYASPQRYRNWYRTTVAHNTLAVDQRRQVPCRAQLLTFAATADVAVVRAATGEAYPGACADRTLVLTRDYAIDLVAAFSRVPRAFDLAWHGLGRLETSLKPEPVRGRLGDRPGYSELTNVRRAEADAAWRATWRRDGAPPLVATFPDDGETAVFTATGWMGSQPAPVLLQRREGDRIAFAAAVNLNKDPDFVTGVSWVDTGTPGARMLKVETLRGADYLLVGCVPGPHGAAGIRTDAPLLFVRLRRPRREASGSPALESVYMAGGTFAEVLGGKITSTRPAMIAAEQVENENLLVQNLAGEETKLELAGLDFPQLRRRAEPAGTSFLIDARGAAVAGAGAIRRIPGGVALTLAEGAGAEFGDTGDSVHLHRAAVAAQRYWTALQGVRNDRLVAAERARRDREEAARNPVTPETVVVVEAEAFTREGGGNVTVTDKKIAARGGSAFLNWDDEGHWLEWQVDVPESGHYHIIVKCCSRDENVRRRLEIDGRPPDGAMPDFYLPATGGWSSSRDDWRLAALEDYRVGRLVLFYLTRGRHTLRLTNINRSVNLDYLVVASPDVPIERREFE